MNYFSANNFLDLVSSTKDILGVEWLRKIFEKYFLTWTATWVKNLRVSHVLYVRASGKLRYFLVSVTCNASKYFSLNEVVREA